MTTRREGSFTAVVRGIAIAGAAGLLLLAGCTRPLLERAIAARGGPLTSLSREVDADVRLGFPGRWDWRFDYRVPDRLRWTIETYGEEQSVSFDGTTICFYLGSASVPSAPPALADFASLVRWMSVTTLDALVVGADVEIREMARQRLPAGTVAGLEVIYRNDGSRYALYFDDADLLVVADGPIVLPTVATGRLRAEFSQFERTDGYLLPRHGRYTLDAEPFFDEAVTRYVPNAPTLTAESFRGPPPRVQR